MMLRLAFVLLLTCLMGLAPHKPALAISTLQDTIRDLPRIFRLPSTYPPNNAVRRDFSRPRAQPPGAGEADEGRGMADEGPDSSTPVVTVPGASAPWAVAISEGARLERDFVCAGVLIAPDWVMTAAHCTFNMARRWPADTGAFVFSDVGRLTSPRHRFAVELIVPHPQYDPRTRRNDLALIKINVKGGAAGAPIQLVGPPASQLTGEIVSILGWGVTNKHYAHRRSESLQVIQGSIVDDDVCFSAPNFPGLRKTGVFCATSLLKHHDVCSSFGGSPLVVYDEKARLYLAGLVSWPATCPAEVRKPNIYLDVQAYVPWIKSVINGSSR